MKRTHLYFITSILLVLFTFAISSCSDDDDVETSTMIVEIDSESNLFYDLTGSLKPGKLVVHDIVAHRYKGIDIR